MKYIIIDDNEEFADEIYKKFNNSEKVTDNLDDLGPLADKLIDGKKESVATINEEDVIFINANLNAKGKTRLKQAGIKLLIWLRIKGVKNHCVHYSFEKLHGLLNRKPEHLIATSKGSTFVQVPNDFDKLKNMLETKREKGDDWQADDENLKKVLKPAFSIEKARHEEANWWGIKALWDAHRLKTLLGFSDPYPEAVRRKLESINNAITVFLYEPNYLTLSETISQALTRKEQRKLKSEEYRVDTNTTTPEIEEKLNDITSFIEEIKREIQIDRDLLNNPDQMEELSRFGQGNGITNKVKNRLNDNVDVLKSFEDQAGEIRKTLDNREKSRNNNKYDRLSTVDRTLNEQLDEVNFDEYEINKKRRLLVIDDLAEKGWEEAYNATLDDNINIDKVSVQGDKSYEQIKTEILKEVSNNSSKLLAILLDLRLYNEDDYKNSIKDYTGCLLLQKIKEKYPYIPVIITTASNKVQTYIETQELGADAYWNKEGIDNYFSLPESVENYNRLKKLIYSFSRPEYEKLKRLGVLLETIEKSSNHFWWEDIEWEKPRNGKIAFYNKVKNIPILQEYKINRGKLSDLIRNSIKLYSQYLSAKYITDKVNEKESGIFLDSLIISFGKILEFIHAYKKNKNDGYISYTVIMTAREDQYAIDLYSLRNTVAHYYKESDVNKRQIRKSLGEFVRGLESYLVEQNSHVVSKEPESETQTLVEKNSEERQSVSDTSSNKKVELIPSAEEEKSKSELDSRPRESVEKKNTNEKKIEKKANNREKSFFQRAKDLIKSFFK